ncbi:hypothetical protein KCU81_g836, partial [Aureobasidium melanogenum]
MLEQRETLGLCSSLCERYNQTQLTFKIAKEGRVLGLVSGFLEDYQQTVAGRTQCLDQADEAQQEQRQEGLHLSSVLRKRAMRMRRAASAKPQVHSSRAMTTSAADDA